VIRGKWILDNIMNAPPPPPPPNVPSLEADANNANLPMREQLQKHRENPTCASCHARMDPLGFGLENFNAIGQWRDQETAGAAIDASGELPGGAKFNGPDELRQVILQSKADFADCLADKMLTYALGRGLTGADQSTVRSIGKQVAENDYRFSSLVLGIVNSPQFQMRSAK
jgi:hypothetical protein